MTELKAGIIIQARLGSTRLPGKVLMPFHGQETILSLIVKGLQTRFSTLPIILATSDQNIDDPIAMVADELGVACFRGDEQDVLSRFVAVAEKEHFSHVVRVCADNPLLDMDLIQDLVRTGSAHQERDYISHCFASGRPIIQSHLGLSAEWVRTQALVQVAEQTYQALYKEHVTNYIYAHPEQFDLHWIDLPRHLRDREDIRLTCDTEADFRLLQTIFEEYRMSDTQGSQVLLSILSAHPEYLEKMQKEIRANEK